MKKFILVSFVALAAVTASSNASFSAPIAGSKYCETNSYDTLCMTDEMMKMRTEMMAMTKEKVMANRSKYCEEHAAENDPICKPDVMGSTTGY